MEDLEELLANNREWSEEVRSQNPSFFEELSEQQSPRYLWIGCSDSRVPANQIVGLAPGELFVHRNVANIASPTDLNCLAVLQFAVDVLQVRHVIVCGHYGCGGVQAVLDDMRLGLVDHWVRHVHDVARVHRAQLAGLDDRQARFNRLCELNVIEQVRNVAQSTVVVDAWSRGADLAVHGWIYGLENGLLRDLGIRVGSAAEVDAAYEAAIDTEVRARGS
ncbi:MAG: carbonate dehydratase [Gemmatimonas sp.]|nr:carbonate dehydratase [Gemmatimonas sp.]